MNELTEKQTTNLKNKVIDRIHKSDLDQLVLVADVLYIDVPNNLRDLRNQMKKNNQETQQFFGLFFFGFKAKSKQ